MTVEEVAERFDVPVRTARAWVRNWFESQSIADVPRVSLVRPQTGRGRTRYVVDVASLEARYPLLRVACAT